MTVDSPALPFEMSLTVWGAVWTGNAPEPIACMAEDRGRDRSGGCVFGRMWDSTARSLDYQVIVDRHGRRTPPLWWALPHLTQHALRGHIPYPSDDQGGTDE